MQLNHTADLIPSVSVVDKYMHFYAFCWYLPLFISVLICPVFYLFLSCGVKLSLPVIGAGVII